MPKENDSKTKLAESVKTEASEQEIDETLDESFPASASAVVDFRHESRKRFFSSKSRSENRTVRLTSDGELKN